MTFPIPPAERIEADIERLLRALDSAAALARAGRHQESFAIRIAAAQDIIDARMAIGGALSSGFVCEAQARHWGRIVNEAEDRNEAEGQVEREQAR